MNTSLFKNKLAYLSTWLNIGLLIAVFSSNFLSYPGLKYLYLVYGFFVFVMIISFDFRTILPVIISYSFIEGQGRILWDYQPLARIAFDGLLTLATIRSFIVTRDLNLRKILPLPMLICIFLHFGWYLVELFNPNSINLFASFAGTKVYIFPFFLFVYFLKNAAEFDSALLKKIGNLIMILLVAECLLALHQLQVKEELLLSISPYYYRAMSFGIFTQDAFRPFGTTQVPGGISVLIFLTAGILLIRKDFSKFLIVSIPFFVSLLMVTLIVCQVRSATLKYVVIFTFSWLMIFYTSPKRITLLFKLTLSSVVVIPLMFYAFFPSVESFVSKYVDLDAGLERWEGITEVRDVTSQRTGFTKALQIASERLIEFPIGVGPGVTGAAGGLSVNLMKNDPVHTRNTFWGHDNFYLSLIIEFGYGFVFYLGFILLVPYYLISAFIKILKQKDYLRARIIGVSLVNIFVILAGNWGAIGMSYNPESFYFWFWAAVGFNTFALSQNVKPSDELHDPV